jgi:bifunctional non-homologous end joining protein LigD
MLARSGKLPTGDGWVYEVKFDGFRAILGRQDGFRVVSRRGWDMTKFVPELGDLPTGCVFDGELVAFEDGKPHFPLVCDRLLHGAAGIGLTYVIFDVLALDGAATIPPHCRTASGAPCSKP